jgi:hypothetical protein
MEMRGEVAEYTFVNGVGLWKNINGQLHRDDFSPAKIFRNKMEYYYYDQLYLVVYDDGAKYIVNPALYRNIASRSNQAIN